MDRLQLYRKRAKDLYRAFIISSGIIFLACLPLYFYFRLPVHPNLPLFTNFSLLIIGLIILPILYLIRKRSFPIESSKDIHWSYTATRRYFWLFSLALLPFALSLVIFIVFALLDTLFIGYLLSLCGLILVRPREEDVV